MLDQQWLQEESSQWGQNPSSNGPVAWEHIAPLSLAKEADAIIATLTLFIIKINFSIKFNIIF